MPANVPIKQMPDGLKARITQEALRNQRSMNKEALVLLEAARAQRAGRTRTDANSIDALLVQFRVLPDLDRRNADQILGYDDNGLPT